MGNLDFCDCPHCGAERSICPSLAGLFFIEDTLLLLDRGYNPEPSAQEALSPLVATLGAALTATRVADLAEFKAVFAAKVKAIAQRYPYSQFDPYPIEENITHWRDLQGEVLTAMLAGAYGAVPNFGLHAGRSDGEVKDRQYTADLILDLIFHLMTNWSVALPALTKTIPLEEALLRLIDSCSPVGLISDRLVEMLESSRRLIMRDDKDGWIRFHFLSVEATLLAMLGRENPHASEWAYGYLMVRWDVRADDASSSVDRFYLSPKRTAATISYKEAWNAAVRIYGSISRTENAAEREKSIRALAAATDDLGHSGLFSAVVQEGVRVGVSYNEKDTDRSHVAEEFTPNSLAEYILAWRKTDNGLPISRMLNVWTLSWYSEKDALIHLFDLLETSVIEMPEERADLLTWFGQRMKLLGIPAPALARIGTASAAWENELSVGGRLGLWTERSNALRLSGEPEAALKIARDVLHIALDNAEVSDSNKATALTNYGISLRETERFEDSEGALLQAIACAPESHRWSSYQSLAATYLQMARISEAADALEIARQTAGDRAARISLFVAEIAARLQLGQHERADTLLRECPSGETMPEAGLIGYGVILTIVAFRRGGRDNYRTEAAIIVERLIAMIRQFEHSGNRLQAKNASHSAAMLAQAFSLPDAEALWFRDAEISVEMGHLPDARTAIELAIIRIRKDPMNFEHDVAVILCAISQQARSIPIEAMTMELLSPLRGPFERLTTLVYELGLGPSAVQILAELQRNAHGKARRSSEAGAPPHGSGIATAEAMISSDAPFLVLEWCNVEDQSLLCLVSRIAPGDAQIAFLETPDIDFIGVARQIGNRLENWRRSRTGEPHLVPLWDSARVWLRGIAETYLAEGGHVVVIDHLTLTGFPYHIALAPEWTVSYAPDWLAVEAAVRENKSALASPRLGVVHAPRSNETKAVREALAASVDRLLQLATSKGLKCAVAGPGVADAEALKKLLSTTDLLKILCHGQISTKSYEVVLLIDHNGQPPPGYSFAALLDTTSEHRFGRTQMQYVLSASRTVFLGACSSGAVSVAGLDERTSLATLLRQAGPRRSSRRGGKSMQSSFCPFWMKSWAVLWMVHS